ncbi:hypothetical protein [Streptomyces thermolilacinus]|uniref:Uncharacterized protein n=1 Tax=Streptomyces thermolilacinus SPC6 TaxID=1306406 RepID=A0A1D3DS04_9ACTN|nr:hypothetical protein [Streptomyces thermolilacinus]OEJ95110.1 hypothetical protein J116_012050 [Streptomyces thermolilacinus SPC6]
MAVTITLVGLLGLVPSSSCAPGPRSYGSAFIAVMFGFFLASTAASGPNNEQTAVSDLNAGAES